MNKKDIQIGEKIEFEHSKSLKKFLKPGVKMAEVSKAIAKDHLKEDKNYYKKLALIENKKGLSQAAPEIVKTKLMPPYDENGKTNFNIRNIPGIYQIFKNNQLVYVGYSHNNVYRTMYHHFNNWNDKTGQWRVKFKDLKGIKVAVVYTKAGKMAKLLESALLLKYRPDLNKNVYNGYIADEKEKAALKKLGQIKPGIYGGNEDLPF